MLATLALGQGTKVTPQFNKVNIVTANCLGLNYLEHREEEHVVQGEEEPGHIMITSRGPWPPAASRIRRRGFWEESGQDLVAGFSWAGPYSATALARRLRLRRAMAPPIQTPNRIGQ
jgi:hypothetical protein